MGSIADFEVYALGYQYMVSHIFHIHVNPFQIVDEPTDTFGGYFQKGDWHDTLKGPTTWGREAPVRLRSQIDRFTGHVIMHCHYLWHQDQGMMIMLNVGGDEGTRYARARAYDPTCYTADFDQTKGGRGGHGWTAGWLTAAPLVVWSRVGASQLAALFGVIAALVTAVGWTLAGGRRRPRQALF